MRENIEEEEIEITFAHFQGEGDAMYNSVQDAIARFQADYPNVVIKQDYYPADAYGYQLEQWDEADEMRDITLILGSNVEGYVEGGRVLALTDLIEDYGISTKISPEYFKELSLGEEIYAIPWEDASYGFIMYNEGIFEEAGVTEFPQTIEELAVAAQKISDAGYIPMAIGSKLLWPLDSILFSALVNNYVGTEWYDSILSLDGTASFLDEEFVDALEALEYLSQAGLFNDNCNSVDNEQRGEMYQNREVAMISAGNWECKSTAELAPEVAEETKIALWPTEDGTSQQSIVLSSAWGMAIGGNIGEKELEYAMIFISEYICDDEFARILAEEQGVYAPWAGEYDTSTIDIITQQVQEVAQAEIVNKCLNWDSTLYASVKDVYQQGLEDIILGNTTPEILAEEMEAAYQELNN